MKSDRFQIEIRNSSSGGHMTVPTGMQQHIEVLMDLVMLAIGTFLFNLVRHTKGGSSRGQAGYGITAVDRVLWQFTMWAQPSGGNENCREFIVTVPQTLRNGQFDAFIEQLTKAIETGERQFTEGQLRTAAADAEQSWREAERASEEAQASLETLERVREKAKQDIAAARSMMEEAQRALANIEGTQLPPAVRIAHEAKERAEALQVEFNKLDGKLAEISRARVAKAMEALSGLSPDEKMALMRQLQQG